MREYLDRYDVAGDAQAGVLGTIKNYTIATAVDTVTSLWNSLPLTPEWKTEDILGAADRDALAFFNENKEAVQASSMVAGSLVPGIGGLKLLNRARSGLSSLGLANNYLGASFSGARQTKIAAEMQEIFRQGLGNGEKFKQLKRSMLASNITREVADNAIVELAVMGAMNAHPYMGDVYESPTEFMKSFVLGAGFGAGIGGLIAVPVTKAAIRETISPIASEAIFTAQLGQKIVPDGYTAAARFQAHTANIRQYDNLLQDESATPLLRDIVSNFKLAEEARRATVIDNLSESISKGDSELKKQVVSILNDPRFIGVDQLRMYNLDRAGVQATAKTIKLDTPELRKLVVTTDEGVKKDVLVFVRPSTGEIFNSKGARNAALAADNPNIVSDLKVGKNEYNILTQPVRDAGENNVLRGISTVQADTNTLKEMKLIDSIPDELLPHIVVDPTDLARQNGLLVKWGKLTDEQKDKINVKIRSDRPTYTQEREFIQQRSVVGKDYEPRLRSIMESHNYYTRRNLSPEAFSLLEDWRIGAGDLGDESKAKGILRRAMDSFLRGTQLPKGEERYLPVAKELWKEGQALRDELRKIADAEGYVYLYRGVRGEVKGAASIESYTIKPGVAAGFGRAEVRRIDVDNIIGALGNRMGEAEILVGSPHHQIVNDIPVTAIEKTRDNQLVKLNVIGKEQKIGYDELALHFNDATEAQVNAMKANGFSIEEISARLNIKKDAIERLYGGQHLQDMWKDELYDWRRYNDVSKIDDYIHAKNRLFAAVGNKNRNLHAEDQARLDAKGMAQIHRETVENTVLTSNSMIARTMLDVLNQKDIKLFVDDLMNRIGEINNANVDKPTIQSADQVLRSVTKGNLISYIGKQIINQTDKLRLDLMEPLAKRLLPLHTRPELISEFNNVVNKLYSLKGWRDIIQEEGTGKWMIVQMADDGKTLVPVKNADESTFYISQPDVVTALEGTRRPSEELLKMHNVLRSITGRPPLSDMGFYIPPLNLVGKNYAYVVDTAGKEQTKLLVAGTAAELEDLMKTYKAANPQENIKVFPKGDQKAQNMVADYVDFESWTSYANVTMQHKGSATLAIPPSDMRLVQNMVSSYENLILNTVRRFTETYLDDVTTHLDRLSGYYQAAAKDQPKGIFKENVPDAARTVKNILLGRDQLEQVENMKKINTLTDALLNTAYAKVNEYTAGVGKKPTKEYFEGLVKTLKDSGVEPIWKSFDEYLATTVPETRNMAPHVLATGQGLLATMQLRMFEVAHAAVNIMSLPILTWSALMEKLPGTNVGMRTTIRQGEGKAAEAVVEQNAIKFPLRVMYEGIRHMFSPEGRRMELLWEEQKHLDQVARAYTDTTALTKAATMSGSNMAMALRAVDKIQDSPIMKLLSSPSDFAEKFTRRITMHVGAAASKLAYPDLGDAGHTIAAVSFSDRAIGNYHAPQRPAMFQGTFGAALGLYQTYFLTFAQHVYRGMESRNFAQLSSLAALQAGIFGISSWPGFTTLSQTLVSHLNDKHVDLESGTFRAFDKDTAELILYGLPSSLGPAYTTRGDLQPRIPTGPSDFAIVNGIKEGFNAMVMIGKKAGEGVNNGTPLQSMMEAISLQSINRPIARWAELVTGQSVTRQGNTVSPTSEVYSAQGVMARVLGVRPIEEHVVRQARHLDTFYGAQDFENRQKAMSQLKTAARDGSLNDEIIANTAGDYLKAGGSSKGWTAAVNEALVKTEEGTRRSLLRKLEPDSPIRRMIDDLY